MLPFRCANCGSELEIADHKAGARVRCPDCNAKVEVPVPAPQPTHCSGCGKPLRNRMRCADCRTLFCSELCVRRHAKMGPCLTLPASGHAVLLAVGAAALAGCLLLTGGLLWLTRSEPARPEPKAGPPAAPAPAQPPRLVSAPLPLQPRTPRPSAVGPPAGQQFPAEEPPRSERVPPRPRPYVPVPAVRAGSRAAYRILADAADAADPQEAEEVPVGPSEVLQGTWYRVDQFGSWEYTFGPETMTVRKWLINGLSRPAGEYHYLVDLSSNPPKLTWYSARKEQTPSAHRMGIFQLAENRLLVHYRTGRRPAGFGTPGVSWLFAGDTSRLPSGSFPAGVGVASGTGGQIRVRTYQRKDGTWVRAHTRAAGGHGRGGHAGRGGGRGR